MLFVNMRQAKGANARATQSFNIVDRWAQLVNARGVLDLPWAVSTTFHLVQDSVFKAQEGCRPIKPALPANPAEAASGDEADAKRYRQIELALAANPAEAGSGDEAVESRGRSTTTAASTSSNGDGPCSLQELEAYALSFVVPCHLRGMRAPLGDPAQLRCLSGSEPKVGAFCAHLFLCRSRVRCLPCSIPECSACYVCARCMYVRVIP